MALGKVGELGNFIRDQRRTARLSLRKMSQMAGISNPYLSQIERGLRRPSAEILQSIAKALRISSETLYVKAGILEERDETVDTVTALLRDHALTEKQREALIEIYHTFRHENETEGVAGSTIAAPRPAKATRPKRAAAAKAPRKSASKKPASRSRTAKRTKTAASTNRTRTAARKKGAR